MNSANRQITAEFGPAARLGAVPGNGGVHFSVVSQNADYIELCLFDAGQAHETQRLRLPGRAGDVHFGFVPGLPLGSLYGLRAYGPYAPLQGHRFDPAKLLADPYALQLDRPFAYDPVLSAPPDRATDTAPLVPRAIVVDLARDATPMAPGRPGFTYEVLVRGFSMRHPHVRPEMRGTLAALAEPAVLDHLTRLGVETVELMPLAAYVDERHLFALGLTNVWGYNPITHMAPDPRLAPGGYAQIRNVVAALHRRGIRVLLDVVLNHSGESDEQGPTLCYRGLDNLLYYRTHPDDPGLLINDTGCGNTMAVEREPVSRLVIDTLRCYVEAAGIDGFRYDLGTVLGREADGWFNPHAPLLEKIRQDPVLESRIHVAEPWDIGPGGYQVGHFPPPFLEWQDRFRDDVRRFWQGDSGLAGALATRLAGSADLFQASGRPPSASVNFLAAHDGFSLADIVAYRSKHNDANGEQNRDGHHDNHSWNHGVEGPCEDAAVVAARLRDVRAMLATLFVARGTPLLTAGDELGRTQSGNNNAYAQDNATVWLDWENANTDLTGFVQRLARLRAAHPALAADEWLTGENLADENFPDAIWLSERGIMRAEDWADTRRHMLGLFLRRAGDGVLAFFNASFEASVVDMPATRPDHGLKLVLASDRPETAQQWVSQSFVLGPRSVTILVEVAI
ncbi:glycogen debranching protein GlgX [Aureimonas fodinaquatilis]|uniref:Glycogen debranching protein GlgX n=1 Tax=Aureimonas fodinaquatilis TaxID=2565783 RepID=A0A5B0DZH4_9HYPH|nr:glycogen debranching protein GlgX [Aureimonas fodinaquatilis]KAA0972217.1 glycogen debranching protein GlgX [Aureimonas fodinaquatilis]